MFQHYCGERIGWFRLFGYGLAWKDKTIYGLLFSQRNKFTKGLSVGKWYIHILKK